jgi:sarcosine oxidase
MDFDVIVVGLGALGSAACWQLARRGARVLGIDRFAPPHDHGSSHGLTRITRLAVGEGPEYVPLVQRSHVLWRQIEAATGHRLMQTTGGLVIGRRDGAAAMHGQADFVASTIAVAVGAGIAHELLDAAAVRARFPPFRLIDAEYACYEPSAGVLFPEACVAAQLALARLAGASLQTGQPVAAIEREGSVLKVRTPTASYRAPQVLVAAGAWIPSLMGDVWRGRLRVQRQTQHWFEPAEPAPFEPARCPIFIWAHGSGPADAFYGFPLADGTGGVKVATAQHEVDTDPGALDLTVAESESEALFARHLEGRVAGLTRRRLRTTACLYTVAPNARFIVERHPALPGCAVASACSGHGFKHSAALGEALAEQLLEGRSAISLKPFGWV